MTVILLNAKIDSNLSYTLNGNIEQQYIFLHVHGSFKGAMIDIYVY